MPELFHVKHGKNNSKKCKKVLDKAKAAVYTADVTNTTRKESKLKLVVLREYEIPEDGQVKFTPPKFWLEKQDAKTLEMCEDAETGLLVIRPKVELPTAKKKSSDT